MRQAGRSLPEYRAIRERHSILEICRTPDLAIEVTLQPVRRYEVDAAILFSDIVVPLPAMGLTVDIEPGVGPVVADPVRSADDLSRLHPLDVADLPFVAPIVSGLVEELDVPLIGFAGAPFTLASYLVEGGPSRDQARTRAMMHSDPRAVRDLMDRLADAVSALLRAQIENGAAAVQLFDSWVGVLSPDDFKSNVLPAVNRIFESLADLDVPRIYFGINTGEILSLMASCDIDVIGIDWRVCLDDARRRVGHRLALQGNLDPTICLAPWDVVEPRVVDVLERGGGRAHIFNLGHGVLPETDPDILRRVVELVHSWSIDS